MGVVRTFEELAGKIREAGDGVEKAKGVAVTKGGAVFKDALSGAGGSMRNLGKGAHLLATSRVAGDSATIRPKPVGAWSIREFGAKPHVITPRGGHGGGKSLGSRKRRALGHRLGNRIGAGDRRAVLNIPGIGYRKFVNHPGSHPRPVWDRTIRVAQPVATAVMRGVFVAAVEKAFR